MDARREYFESSAEDWDKNFTAEDLEVLSHFLESFNVKKGDRIVDLGCGTGVLFDNLRRMVGPAGLVLGLDFSRHMARKAKRNFPFDNCLVIDADAHNIPLPDSAFDMVISFAAFAHFADKGRVISEVARILKPGRSFHILHLLGSKELVAHHHQAGGPVSMDHLPSGEELRKMLIDAHFDEITLTDHQGLYLASAVKR